MYSFSYLEPVCCSMSSSNFCFLTCIQISQEASQVVCYSHLFQNFPQFIEIHTVKGFGIVTRPFRYELNKFPYDFTVEVSNKFKGLGLVDRELKDLWTEVCNIVQFSSVQFSRSVVSDYLQSHGLQYARPPCPSQTPGVYSNSWPLSQWCHPSISSSVVPFSSCFQSFPASGSFQMSQFFASDGQSIGVSASSEYSGLIPFRMDWLDLLAVQETLKSLVQHHSSKASILWCSAFFMVQLSHPYMTTGKIM